MLSDAKKELIRAEEVYRQEVKRELEKRRKSKASWLFEFLNCGLGLFLLSTVFVSVFSWAYGEISHSQERRARTAETTQKLKLEIVNRMDTVQKLQSRFRSEHYSVIRSAVFGFQRGATVNPTWKRFYSPMFPEYGERSLVSLLWQLEVLSEGYERARIAGLRRKAAGFDEYFDKLIYSEEPSQGRTPDNEPFEYYSLPPEDSGKFRAEVLAPFKVLRASLD